MPPVHLIHCFFFLLYRLQSEGEYERAAAIALFNLQIKRSLAILNTPRNADSIEGIVDKQDFF